MENCPLDQEKIYLSSDYLTLDVESGSETRKIAEWLNVDPVRIHRMIVKEKDFPGYSSEVEARIPYDTDPIAFYKWWRKGKHENVVYLSPAYQFKLFQKVSVMEPKVMLKKDIEFVKNF